MSLATEFVWNPDSLSLARRLTTAGRSVCEHGKSHCYIFCGVQHDLMAVEWRMRKAFVWKSIPPEERASWFGRVYGLIFRDNEWRTSLCTQCGLNPCTCSRQRPCKECGRPAVRWCVRLKSGCFYACADHIPRDGVVLSKLAPGCDRLDCLLCNRHLRGTDMALRATETGIA